MNESFEKKLQLLTQQAVNQQVNELDDSVLKRLRESRRLAINNLQSPVTQTKKTSLYFPAWLAPVSTATAFASISLVAASLWLQPEYKSQSLTTPLDDIALLSSGDELEFYENLDFYIWLEEENTKQGDDKSAS